MPDNPQPAIALREVAFTWPRQDRPALEVAGLDVERGDRLFVQGPSGSGKSTLLSLLVGITIPQQGSITILGHRLDQMGGAQRDHFRAHHIGYIFQQFNLVPYLTVIENVTLPLRFSKARLEKATTRAGTPGQEARRLLKHIGLTEDLLHRPVTELSVGQQQRVAAARAMIGAPEVVVADEPTSALDTDTREAFIELLFAECSEAGSTLVFVSHDRSLVGLFNRCFCLDATALATPTGAATCAPDRDLS